MAIIRKGRKYNLEEVLSNVIFTNNKKIIRVKIDGDLIAMNTDKLITFADKGTICVECKIKGQYFVKEKHQSHRGHEFFHFNLYAVDENGKELLMTKDHIVPKYLGGQDDITNYQPMCEVCNRKKNHQSKQKKEVLQHIEKEPNNAFAEAFKLAAMRR